MALNYLRQYVKQTAVPDTENAPLQSAPVDSVVETLGGRLVGEGDQHCLLVENAWASGYRHGLHELGEIERLSAAHFALMARDAELAYTDLTRAVFLDTETTGLSMGAGTYVFLVGAGYFEAGKFHVRQFFLRSPGEESTFLAAIQAFLQRFAVLVTFNGKAFDWPLLESRFVRHREYRRAPLDDPPHIDLLHSARRLWRRRLPSCALSALEADILQVSRTGQDVPGWLIPSLYFQYLRTGEASRLGGVFYHNEQDILSLAVLAVHIQRIVEDPGCGLVDDPLDFLSLGRAYDRAGQPAYASACYEEALRRQLGGPDLIDCLIQLGTVCKRERNWDGALRAWERLIEEGGAGAIHGLVERAKYFEHVERLYMEALDDVQQALSLLALTSVIDADTRELEHRRARLLNRVFQRRSWVRSGGRTGG